ncbi:hypothetical protein TH61_13120 [Rufibacter sp. DG15C]|uniref:magnesium transporter CorA family protein n=1 Tax=Rufibacter sp. DG15C TaxID=1379909 RepID=UPI00078B9D5C|nr:CorA family divalent cation transporter [Rufibacter sp. DG15C]AMM51935.1 hypothetical protein TH61_13120 [Rufibacter sp. DG15C]
MKKSLISDPSTTWQWIDLESPSEKELLEVAEFYKLPKTSVIDSLQPEHLPKFESIGDINFLILRVYDAQAHREADTIQEITNKVAIFQSGAFLITIHRNSSQMIESVREKYVMTSIVKSPADLVPKLVKASLRSYETPSYRLAEELDYYEAKTFLNEKMPPLIKGLYHLKRKGAVCRRVLRLTESVLGGMRQGAFQPTSLQDTEDLHVHLETQFEEVNEGTNNLINTYLSLSSQKTNEVMRVLTLFSAFFLPLTFIAGIYGMNFEFMPELKQRLGYPAVIGIMGAVSLVIFLWFKRKRWL